jgi:superfamily I DNA/RNA helicase
MERIVEQTENLIIEEKEQERKVIISHPVQCLTIWGSKGLKAETVFMLGLEEGYLPKSNTDVKDEEIRLMYVGMTRAIKELNILCCLIRYDGVHSKMGGKNGKKEKSIFLRWLPEDYCEEKQLGKDDIN